MGVVMPMPWRQGNPGLHVEVDPRGGGQHILTRNAHAHILPRDCEAARARDLLTAREARLPTNLHAGRKWTFLSVTN